ncbi:hypothetical protein FXO37_11152 [Capsicum annuum]|nr:hypothetical protein FXO37_11152 [Capsicum annuum]
MYTITEGYRVIVRERNDKWERQEREIERLRKGVNGKRVKQIFPAKYFTEIIVPSRKPAFPPRFGRHNGPITGEPAITAEKPVATVVPLSPFPQRRYYLPSSFASLSETENKSSVTVLSPRSGLINPPEFDIRSPNDTITISFFSFACLY